MRSIADYTLYVFWDIIWTYQKGFHRKSKGFSLPSESVEMFALSFHIRYNWQPTYPIVLSLALIEQVLMQSGSQSLWRRELLDDALGALQLCRRRDGLKGEHIVGHRLLQRWDRYLG